jgi:hypothetical protein
MPSVLRTGGLLLLLQAALLLGGAAANGSTRLRTNYLPSGTLNIDTNPQFSWWVCSLSVFSVPAVR